MRSGGKRKSHERGHGITVQPSGLKIKQPTYSAEFRARAIELHATGIGARGTMRRLFREYGYTPTASCIAKWMRSKP